MGFFKTCGWLWSPELVGWGRSGPTPTREMLGYYAAKLDGKKGRLSKEQQGRQTIDVWGFPGIYALYMADRLIYVGQALHLGDRLLDHRRVDHLAGRWDAFSWASPVNLKEVTASSGAKTVTSLKPKKTPKESSKLSLARFLDEMEAFAILIGKPSDNRQEPGLVDAYWLTQLRSDHADLTTDEMIAELHAKMLADGKD